MAVSRILWLERRGVEVSVALPESVDGRPYFVFAAGIFPIIIAQDQRAEPSLAYDPQ
jgi:hypothetical protein